MAVNFPSSPTTGQLYTEAGVTWQFNGNGWVGAFTPSGGFREVLTADRTYYVRNDGLDTQDGLTNSSGSAFLTLQKAIDVVATLDLSIYGVTIQLGVAGTYAGAIANAPFVGGPGSFVRIVGSTGSPGSYIISSAIQALNNAVLLVRGVDFTSSNYGIYAEDGGEIAIDGACIFGTCTLAHVSANRNGRAIVSAACTIDGNAAQHLVSQHGGFVYEAGVTITLSGTPAFTYFLYAAFGGSVQANGNTYSGSATGQRFFIEGGGVVQTLGALSASYFPGNSTGVVIGGGFHDMLPAIGISYRETLLANRTYYVRSDGNDGNTGLVDSAGGAFLTIQKAVDVVGTLDVSVFNVVVQVRDGTFAGANLKSFVGAGSVTLRGNTSNPGNVDITSIGFQSANVQGNWLIEGFDLAGSFIAIQATGVMTTLSFGTCEFGACSHHIRAGAGAYLTAHANYTIKGNTGYHMINSYANLEITGKTITLTGTPAWANAFFVNEGPSYTRVFSNTYSGAATGQRYQTQEHGICQTNGAGTSYFPGNSAGSETNAVDTYT